jgi:hypothetical protein
MSVSIMGAALVAAPVLALGVGLGPASGTVSGTVGGTVGGAVGGAVRGESGSAESWGQGLTEACERIPNRIERAERIQARLAGSAVTRGSIAYLEARIDRVGSEGKTDLARLLTNRLETRRDIQALLPDVLERLKDSEQICADHTSASSGSS